MFIISRILKITCERNGSHGAHDSIRIIIVTRLDNTASVGHFTDRSQMIAGVIVARARNLLALREEPFGDVVSRIALLRRIKAVEDELLGAGDSSIAAGFNDCHAPSKTVISELALASGGVGYLNQLVLCVPGVRVA